MKRSPGIVRSGSTPTAFSASVMTGPLAPRSSVRSRSKKAAVSPMGRDASAQTEKPERADPGGGSALSRDHGCGGGTPASAPPTIELRGDGATIGVLVVPHSRYPGVICPTVVADRG